MKRTGGPGGPPLQGVLSGIAMVPGDGPVWGPGPTGPAFLPIEHPVGPDPQVRPFPRDLDAPCRRADT